ncbi:MAG: manganese efflux pump MntP family protein [Bacteroidales bacterium]|nr:manganese efflux pump MntP family protein [Bacteroidales bacterium]
MGIWECLLLALSLCADCFAVSLCSSVKLRNPGWKRIAVIALAFAVIQTGLLLAGWGFGELFVGLLGKAVKIVAFLLLLYVGGSMLLSAILGKEEALELNSFRNVVLGGVATSIDAAAVGAAQSISGVSWPEFMPLLVAVFVITALSVILGISGGSRLGKWLGRTAEIIGGAVLLFIAFWNLFR